MATWFPHWLPVRSRRPARPAAPRIRVEPLEGRDVPATSVFSFSAPTYSIGEGGGLLTVTVTRTITGTGSNPTKVAYATADGTATAGADYTAAAGTVSFGNDQTSKTFTIPVLDDAAVEGNETFTLALTAVNAGDSVDPTRGAATATITDDDTPSLSVTDVSRAEGQAGSTAFDFTVTLSGASTLAVTVNYATADGTATVAGGDYAAASGTLTFAPGETSKTVRVTVPADNTPEADETFVVTLSGATNALIADGQGVGTILNDDTAPVANPDAYSVNEDATLTVAAADGVLANDTDAQNDPLTAVLVSDVTHGTLTLNPGGGFTYVPTTNFHGTDTFTYKANDGFLDSAVTTVTITVDSVNDAPAAGDQSVGTNEDTPLTGAVSATDADADTLTYGLVGDVTHGSLTLNTDGSFTYTPAADFHGTDSFTFKANDGTADSNVATVTITVSSVNDAPVAADQSASTAEDTPLTGTVSAADADGDGVTYSLVTDAAHGTVTLSPDGSFTYTPAANYNGPDSFTFRANDGTADSNVATVAVTVAAVNDAPVLAGTAVLDGIAQGNFNPAGQTVSSLFGPLAGDLADGDALAGIAVVGNTADPVAQGAWQYSTDGVNWFDVGPVSGSAALLLSADTSIRFKPAAGFAGDPAPLVARAIDASYLPGLFTDGTTQVVADTSSAGGASAFSAGTAAVQSPVFFAEGAWLSAVTGNLYVTGTTGNEAIVVRPASGGRVLVVRNGVVTDTFTRSQVTGRISLYGLDGNDRLVVSSLLANPADLYGGAGNDILYGGSRADRLFGEGGNDRVYGRAGNDVLVGGDGNDILGGGAGNDVLVGGNGADLLQGSLGSDLLIGGTTAFDLDPAALSAIAAEWGSPASYGDRIAHLGGATGGLNGTTVLTAGTVPDDGVRDVLGGYSGLDLFWTGTLDLFTKGATEIESIS